MAKDEITISGNERFGAGAKETDMKQSELRHSLKVISILLLSVFLMSGCGSSISKEAESIQFKEKQVVAYGKDVTDQFSDGELADMIFEAIDDENFSNGAIDLGYTAENLKDRINAMKNEGVYVKVAFDSQYTHGDYTFQSITVLGNPKLLGVEFQLDSQSYGYASDIAKKIAKKVQ